MFTSFFCGPRRARTALHCTTEDRLLRRLLESRALHPYRFHARCEIGPFMVANVCRERSLIVELCAQAGQRERQLQRAGFLAELGYSVLQICPRELRRHPRRVLRRIQAALRPSGR
jgi:very-short-patch-repair endonuclease